MILSMYGLANCDTCRKARKWLDGEGISYTFVDVRKDGIGAQDVARWAEGAGWETLLNKRSTTWRELSDDDKAGLNAARAIALMAAHPTLVKRPVFELGGVGAPKVHVGFTKDVQKTLKS